jgi:hypothetical protein
MIFITPLAICSRIANTCMRWSGIFKGLSQDGGQADFSKNLLASLFNKGLFNESAGSISLDSTFKGTGRRQNYI